MKKATLAKMDEVSGPSKIFRTLIDRRRSSKQVKHVLVERDILTATKTPWLVRLLYAFQDREHVYLAMVRIKMMTDYAAESLTCPMII